MSVEGRFGLSGKFLKEAEELLRNGDYAQASGKLWVAVIEPVKAVAASRDISLGTRASLFQFVSQLARKNPELGLVDAFHVANSLCTNSYQDWLSEDFVRRGAEIVQAFIDKPKRFLRTENIGER
ncbi:MAG: PaREP1 family protein [Candidatus Caldarchaeum sp.]